MSNARKLADKATHGSVVQIAYTELFGPVTLSSSATIPADNTIPQSNEGTELMTVTITPKKATNYLLVEAVVFGCEQTNVGDYIVCPLFRDSGADAVAVGVIASMAGGGNYFTEGYSVVRYRVLAGSTSATTFKVRAGNNNGTGYINVVHQNFNFGNKIQSSLTVTEIEA